MRGKRRKRREGVGDPEGVQRAQAELARSQARLEATTRSVTDPLLMIRHRNNVLGIAQQLMHEIRHAGNGA